MVQKIAKEKKKDKMQFNTAIPAFAENGHPHDFFYDATSNVQYCRQRICLQHEIKTARRL